MNQLITRTYAAASDLNKTLKYFISESSTETPDKCKDLGVVMCILERLFYYLLFLAGILTFIMIVYTAIIYLTSYGDESKIEMAKKTLIWSVIGVLVILFSRIIIGLIGGVLNS